MNPSRTIRLLTVFLVLIGTAGCDQATKHLARTQLSPGDSTSFAGNFIEFTLAENPGAFLSFGASIPAVPRIALFTAGVTLGLALLLVYLLRSAKLPWPAFFGLALICSGGTSNLFDRLARHGLVTDFMVVRAGPLHTGVFNLADLAVLIGLFLCVASLYLGSSRDRRQAANESE